MSDNKRRGLLVHVFRSSLGDCTNEGVTAHQDQFYLYDPETPFENAPEIPDEAFEAGEVLLVDYVTVGDRSYFARPATEKGQALTREGHAGPMAGGNFVSTSDSRFRERFGDALRVHDLFETWEDHRRFSA